MEDMTYVTVSTRVWLLSWSPDSTRLLVQTQGESTYFVIDAANPATPLPLPTDSPAFDGRPHYGDWIDNARLSMGSGIQRRVAEVDVSGSSPVINLGPAIEEGSISRSPDGNHFAVSRSGFQVSNEYSSRTAFYRIEPFELIAAYDGIAVQAHEPSVWTADGSRIVALRDACTEDETLILLDIATGAQIDLASMGTSQVALSPDEALVAFGTSGLVIVPADGSAPALMVFERPGAPGAVARPEWSRDGRFISFVFGGYGRCP
jgi:WD40 repeat protein